MLTVMDGVNEFLNLAVGILSSGFRLVTDEADKVGRNIGLTKNNRKSTLSKSTISRINDGVGCR